MVDERDEMVRELQQLRRGHGLLAPDVMSRVGPRLAEVCGIESGMPAGEPRRLLIAKISTTVQGLADDLRLPVQAAFALEPGSTARFLRERMEWLGHELARDPRTAVRRVEAGLVLLAEALLDPARAETDSTTGYAPDGWFVNRLRSTLMLHLDPVQLLETRRVTSTRDGLQEITVSWSVPAQVDDSPPVQVDMLFGGRLVRNEEESTPRYWAGVIRLPRPLAAGEQHEYQVRVTSHRGQLRPYYVLTPFRRFDEFVLRAKFDPARMPGQVWRLDGVPFQVLEEDRQAGEPIAADSVGEVEGRFVNLRQGMSYGLGWLEPGEPESDRS